MKFFPFPHKHTPTTIEKKSLLLGEGNLLEWESSNCAKCGKWVTRHKGKKEWTVPPDPFDGMDDSFDILFFGLIMMIFGILIALGVAMM